MSALTSPAYEILPPSSRSAEEARPFRYTRPQDDWFYDGFADRTPPPGKQASQRHLARFLAMFLLGAAAIVACYSYGRAARETLAGLSPELEWLAPPAERAENTPDKVEEISRSVDRIAASIDSNQQQITHSIAVLAADQAQMTREIVRLQELSQSKGQEPRSPVPGGHRAARRSP
jgi:hypothetical protein